MALGGGTYDAHPSAVEEGVFEVRATNRHAHLGGEDLDDELLDYCIKDPKDTSEIDTSKNSRAFKRLRAQFELAKRILVAAHQAPVECDALAKGEYHNLDITRAKFGELCIHLFRECTAALGNVF